MLIQSGIQPPASGTNQMTFDLATNLTPIIQGVIDIMPVFLDLVIAMVPVVITLAVVGFLLGFFDKILQMIKF
jgi:hypothetical protein